MKKLNRYLFYVLALFPILNFAILNIIIVLFFITIPFDLKTFSTIQKKKVFFILALLALTIIPVIIGDFQCSVLYWFKKIFPLYISSILLLLASPFIANKEYKTFKNIYLIGTIFYVIRFVFIVLIEVYNGKLDIIFEKNFLFYSDIMNLLRSDIDVLDSNYHKPYFSLVILLALFFATKKFFEEKNKNKTINFSLILFYLAAIVFPLSLPNIVLIFIYLFYLIFILFRKNKIILSGFLLIFATSLITFLFYKSFINNNLDTTEDVGFVMEYVKGENQESTLSQSNPRQIIYSALLEKLDKVPFLGFGYCEGKETVTEIIEKSIYDENTESLRNNILIDTDKMESHLWKKNGIKVEKANNSFLVAPRFNNCQSHTLYQIVNDLKINKFYTFSISVKSAQSNVVLRIGELNNQMVVFDLNKKNFSHIGKDILNQEVKVENNGFYRISVTTKIKSSKNIALIGFSGKNNKYNHCYDDVLLNVKYPQLEFGLKQTVYSKGFSKNEMNILGSNINAHNIFLQEYYLGGVIGLMSIIMLYGWFLYLGRSSGDKLLLMYILAVIFNSFFENIQYRQMGISIIIIISILLIFKRKE